MLPTENFLKNFSWNFINMFLRKWYSIDISQLPNGYASPHFYKKIIHLLKVTGKNFDLLKPESY